MRRTHPSAVRACLAAMLGLTACASRPAPPAEYFSPGQKDPFGGSGSRTAYTLDVTVLFEKDRVYNQEVGLALSLASWREEHAQRFVLDRARHPPHSVFSWQGGTLLGPRNLQVAVKTLVEIRDPERPITDEKSADLQRAIARAAKVLEAWEVRYPDLVRKRRPSYDPKIVFWTPEPLRGRWGFYRSHQGAVLVDEEGQLRPETLLDRVESRYRWHKPGQPDPVSDPSFFKGLGAALSAWHPSPFPDDDPEALAGKQPGATWTANNTLAINALLRAIVTWNERVGQQLDDRTRVPFEMVWRLVAREGALDRLESQNDFDADTGGRGDLGEGYRLYKHRRDVAWDRKRRVVVQDRVTIEAGHRSGDRIQMRLALQETGG